MFVALFASTWYGIRGLCGRWTRRRRSAPGRWKGLRRLPAEAGSARAAHRAPHHEPVPFRRRPRGTPVTTTDSDIYYDPYDFEIDTDPYPIWRRLREERPLYYNERYDFYALTRFDDVERGLIEWKTYSW